MGQKDYWFKFCPTDWLTGTRGLTPSESGIYITLIAMMYERQTPLDFDQKRLARLCNATAKTMREALETLISLGKIIETDEGLWNDRVGVELAARIAKSEQAKENADKRWNAQNASQESQVERQEGGKSVANSKVGLCGRNASKSKSKRRTSMLSPDGETIEAHGDAERVIQFPQMPEPDPDPDKAVFDLGVAILTSGGTKEGTARSLVAKWKRDHGTPAVLELLQDVRRRRVSNVVEYVTAALNQRKDAPPKQGEVREFNGVPYRRQDGIWVELTY